jgi:hypothetical protein
MFLPPDAEISYFGLNSYVKFTSIAKEEETLENINEIPNFNNINNIFERELNQWENLISYFNREIQHYRFKRVYETKVYPPPEEFGQWDVSEEVSKIFIRLEKDVYLIWRNLAELLCCHFRGKLPSNLMFILNNSNICIWLTKLGERFKHWRESLPVFLPQYVYVLALDNNKYYVGKTIDIQSTYIEHCDGTKIEWTRIHRPRGIKWRSIIFYPEEEMMCVRLLIGMYGIDNVRGGIYNNTTLTIEERRSIIAEDQYNHGGICNNCFNQGHLTEDCPQPSRERRRQRTEYDELE